jgi:putative flippase GtrA
MSRPFRRRFPSREVRAFLLVGGTGYVVDVATFNALRSVPPFDRVDPAVARSLAVLAAMCVTYIGNRTWTWSSHSTSDQRREVGLFVVFNVVGLGFSVLTLLLSHDVLGLTSRLADNLSANVIGLALGTVFRYLTYKRFVFPTDSSDGSPGRSGTGAADAPATGPAPVGHPGQRSRR